MYLLVGLGNPDDKYKMTRHNAGFLFLEFFAEKYGAVFGGSKWRAEVAKIQLWGETIQLVKPLTFMNLSGTAVALIVAYYRVPVKNIIVVHDDLDLSFGRIKIVAGRGAGGHNGIRSLIDNLGGNEFARVRVGIGRPRPEQKSSSYVLSQFNENDLQSLQDKFPLIEKGIKVFIEKGVAEAMNAVNSSSEP